MNRGSAIQESLFKANHVTVANNSVYNNTVDTELEGTYRPGIGSCCDGSQGIEYFNNISYAIVGTGVLQDNSAFSIDGPPGPEGIVNNIAMGPANEYNGGTSSCTSNQCNTDPLWADVGTLASGDQNTPSNGHNFALEAGSPAIGNGVTKPYLGPQAVDVGACHHTLTTCP